jgi:hypothetical protein
MWDRGLRVRNVSFINFPSPNTQAIFGPVINGRCVVFCGGREASRDVFHICIVLRLSQVG